MTENKENYWKEKYADIHIRLTNKIAELEQENRELSFAIEKCLENAGIECDDEEQALRSLPMLGNAHYKVLVEKEALEQENKELKAYKDINEDFKKAWDKLNKKYKHLRSALGEIRGLASPHCTQCSQIIKIVNEVLE